jgi:hypothetical protein
MSCGILLSFPKSVEIVFSDSPWSFLTWFSALLEEGHLISLSYIWQNILCVLANMVVISHIYLVSIWNMANETEEMNLNFSLF